MSTIIPGSVTLTPIGAVDTSSATSGVSMFTLNFDAAVIAAGNIIQFEYWIAPQNEPLPALINGFIPLEDAVTTQGISNQCTIAIPSSNNVYNPDVNLEVKVRVYVGETTTSSPEIRVSEWSNTCPIHNAPQQPGTPVAYLLRGEYPPTYYYNDVLYVQIPDNSSYVNGEIDFIVSYSYKDESGEYRWIVTQPLTDWTRYTFTNPSANRILLPVIQLPDNIDVDHNNPIYVAVNAVYNYTFQNNDGPINNYFSVSEISTTVQATEGGVDAPVLETIVIPDDYLVYNTPSTQQVVLNWLPPASSLIPVFSVTSYTIELLVDGSIVDSVTNLSSSTLTYTYTIPETYVTASTTTNLVFRVKAFLATGGYEQSNEQSVNTFRYATAPTNLIVNWANPGEYNGLIDLALSFNNPANNGLGPAVDFVVNLKDALGDIKSTQNVSYIDGVNPYVVIFHDVPSTITGTVQVYMVNQDTNAQTVGGEFVNLNGAAASANYVADDLPLMLSYTNNGSVITSEWITHTVLDRVCVMNFWNPDAEPPAIQSKQFLTEPGTYTDYSVTRVVNSTGDFIYYFTFNSVFFPAISLFDSPLQCLANTSGIGVGDVRSQLH